MDGPARSEYRLLPHRPKPTEVATARGGGGGRERGMDRVLQPYTSLLKHP